MLTDNQYGFRANRSTSMASLDSVEEITNSIDQKQQSVGIFLDIKKAFHTINHDILIKKLERYGIRGIVGNWVRSYLSHRYQFVTLGDCSSVCLDIVCGVPRGQCWAQNGLFFT